MRRLPPSQLQILFGYLMWPLTPSQLQILFEWDKL
jgi:hypothetical protein